MDFKLSVIIPTYNREYYLKKTINSVINQTIGFNNIELIIIDDASTDNTRLIIEEYAKEYSNIKTKYLNKNTGYAGKPRNVGISLATSNYIMFLDSDDHFEKNACEILYERISNEKADIVFGTYVFHKMGRIVDGTPEYFRNKGVLKFNPKNEEFLKVIELLPSKISINIFSKKMIDKHGLKFPEGIPGQDSSFIIESFFNAKNIIYLTDFTVYNYVLHDGSVTTTININYFKGVFESEDYIFNIFKNEGKQEDYKYHLKRKINFFIKQLLSSDIEDKKDLNEVFDLFKDFFEKNSIYNIVLQDDLNELVFCSIKNKDINGFFQLKNIYSKINGLLNQIAELQTIKGWVNYKKSNLISRIKK